MAFAAEELLIGGSGNIYVAPVGTALPTAYDTVLNAAFHDLGYTSEDGVTFVDATENRESRVWQSFYVARRSVTSRSTEVRFALKQWNDDTVSLAFGGGTWTATSAGHWRYNPPPAETVDERAMVVDVLDGTEVWRIVVARGMVVSSVEANFRRSDDAALPITFGVNAQAGVDPWYLLTNSEAILPAS